MKRLMIATAALASLAALGNPAAAAKYRVESFTYTGASQVGTPDQGYGAWIGPGCAGAGDVCVQGANAYETRSTERAVKVKIADQTGAKVQGFVSQRDGVQKWFCGSSGRVPIEGGQPVTVWVSANPCGSTPEGAPTTGTVTTRFLRG